MTRTSRRSLSHGTQKRFDLRHGLHPLQVWIVWEYHMEQTRAFLGIQSVISHSGFTACGLGVAVRSVIHERPHTIWRPLECSFRSTG
jgi:hypothetical protein